MGLRTGLSSDASGHHGGDEAEWALIASEMEARSEMAARMWCRSHSVLLCGSGKRLLSCAILYARALSARWRHAVLG